MPPMRVFKESGFVRSSPSFDGARQPSSTSVRPRKAKKFPRVVSGSSRSVDDRAKVGGPLPPGSASTRVRGQSPHGRQGLAPTSLVVAESVEPGVVDSLASQPDEASVVDHDGHNVDMSTRAVSDSPSSLLAEKVEPRVLNSPGVQESDSQSVDNSVVRESVSVRADGDPSPPATRKSKAKRLAKPPLREIMTRKASQR